jgi:hypothetical protein
VKCLLGGNGDNQRLRIGITDVFRSKADHPPRDIKGIFSGGQHPPQPVKSCIRIAAPQALMQGGNQIVMFFAVFVV